jgi:prepilin-type N-terminal cleavage/methylation domain-containing protein
MTGLHRWTSDRRLGFTIIELLMVVAIISLVTAWAMPRLDLNRYRADAAGRLARTLLQTAQRNAITRQSNVIVSFDLTNNRLRIVQDYNNNDTLNASDKVDFRVLPEGGKFVTPTWAGVKGTTPSAAVSGPSLRTVSSLTSVIFRRDGSASSDVELYVTMRGAVKTEYRAVTVIGATGKTNLFRWNGSSWNAMTQ